MLKTMYRPRDRRLTLRGWYVGKGERRFLQRQDRTTVILSDAALIAAGVFALLAVLIWLPGRFVLSLRDFCITPFLFCASGAVICFAFSASVRIAIRAPWTLLAMRRRLRRWGKAATGFRLEWVPADASGKTVRIRYAWPDPDTGMAVIGLSQPVTRETAEEGLPESAIVYIGPDWQDGDFCVDVLGSAILFEAFRELGA